MRRLWVIAALAIGLSACGLPDPDRGAARRSDTRQIPTNTTPGVHLSGHVNVGVVKSF